MEGDERDEQEPDPAYLSGGWNEDDTAAQTVESTLDYRLAQLGTKLQDVIWSELAAFSAHHQQGAEPYHAQDWNSPAPASTRTAASPMLLSSHAGGDLAAMTSSCDILALPPKAKQLMKETRHLAEDAKMLAFENNIMEDEDPYRGLRPSESLQAEPPHRTSYVEQGPMGMRTFKVNMDTRRKTQKAFLGGNGSSGRSSTRELDQIELENRTYMQALMDELAEIRLMSMKDFLRCLVHSLLFDILFTSVIAANAITIAVTVDNQVTNPEAPQNEYLRPMELVFFAAYTVEVVLRIWADGIKKFFSGPEFLWNIYALALVIMQAVEEVALASAAAADDVANKMENQAQNMSLVRTMRVLRIARILRTVRVLQLVEELRAIVVSIIGSARHVLWTLMLLFFVIYITAVYLVSLVGTYITTEQAEVDQLLNPELYHALRHYFSSVPMAILSLYQMITNGVDWESVARPLSELVGHQALVMCIVFTAFVNFALFNAVTGVFVEAAVASADKSKQRALLHLARKCFCVTDVDKSGSISVDEFLAGVDSKEMNLYFQMLDVDIGEAATLFELIDNDGDGTLDVDEFVAGCFRLRGSASAIQFTAFMKDFDKFAREVTVNQTRMKSVFTDTLRAQIKQYQVSQDFERSVQHDLQAHYERIEQLASLVIGSNGSNGNGHGPKDHAVANGIPDNDGAEFKKKAQELLGMLPSPEMPRGGKCTPRQPLPIALENVLADLNDAPPPFEGGKDMAGRETSYNGQNATMT
eukprot:TRINITY_DN12243_c0_g2_i1.p1 TRINITY_DN12243_c0_g2~~TRINITY_DN12243_c0_g2_i1.p1  ORF type:complete len:757 (+),score=220.39 TRINITY_DN12243_c0_g2_i1:116-2386(+)